MTPTKPYTNSLKVMDKQENTNSVTPTVNPAKTADLTTQKSEKNPIFEFLKTSENLCLQLIDPESTKPIYSLTIEENVTSLLERENESILSQNDDKPCHSWTFGRSTLKSTFLLKDIPRFSNLHFEITLERNCRLYLKDLSTNGTWLNGHQIPHNLKVKLADGDVIGIGYGILEQACNFEVDLNTGFMAQYRYYFLKQLKKAVSSNTKNMKNSNVASLPIKRGHDSSNKNETAMKKQKKVDSIDSNKAASPDTPVQRFKQNLQELAAKNKYSEQKKEEIDSKRVTNEKLQFEMDNDEEQLQVQHYNALNNKNVKTIQELPVSQRFDFQRSYEIKDVILGKGAFGVVKKCLKKSTKVEYAVKIMKRNKLDEKTKVAFLNEIGMLNNLSHKRILNVDHSSWDKTNYYIVSELVRGGDLMDFVGKYGAIDEKASIEIAYQILEGVQYLHSKSIIHRDLKPDNILIVQDCPVVIKIADFGLSKKGHEFKSFCGTMAYLAPEVVGDIKSRHDLKPKNQRSAYTTQADMWSIGCLVYVILTNHLPFSAPTEEGLFDIIRKGKYSEIPLIERMISSACLDFLQQLINVDKAKRYTATMALGHAWFGDRREAAGSDKDNAGNPTQNVPLSQLPRGTAENTSKINKEEESIMDKWKQNPFMDGTSQPWKKQKDGLISNSQQKATNTVPETKRVDGLISSPNELLNESIKRFSVSSGMQNVDFAAFKERILSKQNEKNNFKNVSYMDGVVGFSLRNKHNGSTDESEYKTHFDVNLDSFCIGRSRMCDYVLEDMKISKLHCVFLSRKAWHNGNPGFSMWIYSYSTNQIFVNDVKLQKFSKIRVWPGDVIKLVYNVQNSKRIEMVMKYIAHEIDFNKTIKPPGMGNWGKIRNNIYNKANHGSAEKPLQYKCEFYGQNQHKNKHCVCSAKPLITNGNQAGDYPQREGPIHMSEEEVLFAKDFLIQSL